MHNFDQHDKQEQQDVPELKRSNEVYANYTVGPKVDALQWFESITRFIKSITPLLWLVVILVVLIPLLGRGFITSSLPRLTEDSTVHIYRTLGDQNRIDQAILVAIKDAHNSAESFATKELDVWVDELMDRVDSSFLDWYFGYFNQKNIEYTGFFTRVSSTFAHWIDTNNPLPKQKVAEKFTEEFQIEFAKRVMRPKIAQQQLERLTQDTINLYVSELSKNITSIQSSYKIPQGNWERYLNDIAVTIFDTDNGSSTLSLKLLAGGSSYLAAKPLIAITAGKVSSKMATKLAGAGATKMAAKTGGAIAAKVGVELLDPIIGIGILLWDVWDYKHTVEVSRPILHQNILDYLKEVKMSLLQNPENGVLAAINQLESGILKSVSRD